MAQPLIYEEDVTTLYPQQGRGSLRSRPWREEEDFHMQKTPISPRPVSDPLGPQLDSQPDLQFISPQPSTVGQERHTADIRYTEAGQHCEASRSTPTSFQVAHSSLSLFIAVWLFVAPTLPAPSDSDDPGF